MGLTGLKEFWGNEFTEEQLNILQEEYNSISKDYEFTSLMYKNYVKKACVASLRCNEALNKGDAVDAKFYFEIYDATLKSLGITPVQEIERRINYNEREKINPFLDTLKQLGANNDKQTSYL